MKSYSRKTLVSAMAALGFLSTIGSSQAALFEVDFITAGTFSGVAPGSPSPTTIFATAVFDDHGGSGAVTLTMHVDSNLSAGAYVNDWYFNVSSAPLGAINFVSGVAASTVDNGVDAFQADGDGKYDFAFHFSTAAHQLSQGSTSVYDLTDTGITASSFNSLSFPAGGAGPFISAVHVQGYGNSSWIAGGPGGGVVVEIPEPATLALLGLGLLGIAATRRRT